MFKNENNIQLCKEAMIEVVQEFLDNKTSSFCKKKSVVSDVFYDPEEGDFNINISRIDTDPEETTE